MRLTMWVVPTLIFCAAAAGIVQKESSKDGPAAADDHEIAALPASIEGTSLPLRSPIFQVEREESPLLTSPPSGGPMPVWRIQDLDFPGSVLSSSDVPTLSISHSKAIPETAVQVAAVEQMAAVEKPATASRWEIVGHSASGKPIHARRFGTSGPLTLIVCGLDGEDRIAVKWVDGLAEQLVDAPEMCAAQQIVLLRAPNPEGLTAKKSSNDRGVLLNQNFPTPSYRPSGTAGASPASEAETRVVLEVLYKYQPQRLIHVQSAGRSEISCNAAAEKMAGFLQQSRHLNVQPWATVATPGSIEDFGSQILQSEVITMRLSTGDDWRSAGINHLPTFVAAAGPMPAASQTVAQVSPTSAQVESIEETPSPFSDPDAETNTLARLERRGYEELPPPPNKPQW